MLQRQRRMAEFLHDGEHFQPMRFGLQPEQALAQFALADLLRLAHGSSLSRSLRFCSRRWPRAAVRKPIRLLKKLVKLLKQPVKPLTRLLKKPSMRLKAQQTLQATLLPKLVIP